MIRSGAKLIEQVDHIFEELAPQLSLYEYSEAVASEDSQEKDLLGLNDKEKLLLNLVGYELTPIDLIVQRSGLSAEDILIIMMELELKGAVVSIAGGYIKA